MRPRIFQKNDRPARKRSALKKGGDLVPFRPGPVLQPALGERNHVSEPFRHGDHLHVSDLISQCVRKVALSDLTGKPILRDPLYFNIELVFEQGRAVERFLRDQLQRRLPNELYGDWVCACETTAFTGVYADALDHRPCTVCNMPVTNYREIVYKDDGYWVTGAVDIHLLRDGALLPVESKSVNANKWRDITAPEPNHVSQALWYWHLMSRRDLPLHDLAVIAYTGKDVYRGFPIKEYPQHASRAIHRIEDLIEEAIEWADFRNSGTLPTRRCCSSPSSPKARKCVVATECFEHD